VAGWLGYLDDRRFAGAYVAEKQRSGWGPSQDPGGVGRQRHGTFVVDEAVAAREDAGSGASEEADTALEDVVRRRFGGSSRLIPKGPNGGWPGSSPVGGMTGTPLADDSGCCGRRPPRRHNLPAFLDTLPCST